jgi:hypothetical protein
MSRNNIIIQREFLHILKSFIFVLFLHIFHQPKGKKTFVKTEWNEDDVGVMQKKSTFLDALK